MRRLITTLAVAALAIGFAGVSEAKAPQCKDASGKFMKCPEAPATPVGRCRDKTTKKFAKCSAANTEPVPVATTTPAASPSPKPTPAATSSVKPMPSPSVKPTTSPKP
jgi:hypothetical protein